MKLSPESLARASSRHPWRTLGVWLVVIIAAGVLSSDLLGGVLNQDIAFTNKPESVKAQDILDARFTPGGNKADSTEFFVIQSKSLTVDDPQYQSLVTALKGQIATLDGSTLVGQPTTYYDVAQHSKEQAAGLVSKDGRTTLISVGLKKTSNTNIEKLRAIADRNDRPDRGVRGGRRRRHPDRDGAVRHHDRARAGDADRSAVRVQPVRDEHGHDDRPGGRDRLLTVHRVPVPRGAEEGLRQARGHRRRRRHGQPSGLLQRVDGRARAARDVHHPYDHLPGTGRRSDPGDPGVPGRVDDVASGDPRAAGRPNQLAEVVKAGQGRQHVRSQRRGVGPDHPGGHGSPRRVPNREPARSGRPGLVLRPTAPRHVPEREPALRR